MQTTSNYREQIQELLRMASKEKSMPSAIKTLLFVLSAAALTASQTLAQTSDHDWAKTYSISGKPSLTVETADSNLKIQSCGECKAININVHSTRNLSEYRLEESQSGDHVSFLFKEKPHIGVHVSWHNREETLVVV